MSIFTNYLEFTRTTAIYPEHSDEPAWVYYLPLGLADEAGELLEKVLAHAQGEAGIHKSGIIAELGDVLWYAARLADSMHYNLDALAATEYKGNADLLVAAVTVSIKASFIAGRAKKIVRDGSTNRDANILKMAEALGELLAACRAVSRYFNTPLEQVAFLNQQKLSSRKDRGVLQGDGDNR